MMRKWSQGHNVAVGRSYQQIWLVITAVFVCLYCLVSICAASKPDVTSRAAADDISSLVEWVKATGVVTVVRSHIAAAAGLPDYDLPVHERGFRSPASGFTDMIAVAKNLRDVVIIARVDESDGSAITWRTSTAGRIDAVVMFNPPAAPVSAPVSAEHRTTFEAVKRFLRKMMAQRQREAATKP